MARFDSLWLSSNEDAREAFDGADGPSESDSDERCCDEPEPKNRLGEQRERALTVESSFELLHQQVATRDRAKESESADIAVISSSQTSRDGSC